MSEREETMNNDVKEPVKNGKMGPKQFWLRLILWILFAVIVPVAFVLYKYQMLSPSDSQEVSHYKLTGWGVLAIIIISVFLLSVIRQVANGLPEGSMTKQCVKGFLTILPVFVLLLLVHVIKNTMDAFEQFLIVLFVSEAVAIPINPIPKWSAQNNIDMQNNAMLNTAKNAIDYYLGKKDKK